MSSVALRPRDEDAMGKFLVRRGQKATEEFQTFSNQAIKNRGTESFHKRGKRNGRHHPGLTGKKKKRRGSPGGEDLGIRRKSAARIKRERNTEQSIPS